MRIRLGSIALAAAAVALLSACATTRPPPRYDFFRALGSDEAFAGKIRDWQRRERAEPVVLPAAPSLTAAERSGMLADPFGHLWFLHQVLETLEPDEIKRRFAAAYDQG